MHEKTRRILEATVRVTVFAVFAFAGITFMWNLVGPVRDDLTQGLVIVFPVAAASMTAVWITREFFTRP